ncbi:FAD-binding oxidoreductase [Curtobacterium sp. VKM Ac-1393]|uniref:FAD-binding oxidoreductase n=1 Tax=Curtobacterium sp. VKM Ac-1393 TaxID=2783814 RepID=UPI00188B84F0|nr:FAD-linked oxidase C-terminal domain-containing protein [Curtobacterium sp. VKM Ac-1393]MBF4609430.1 FAD-binding protein [Curtobacterium sp. VKM Ac-1393]
MSGTTEAPTHPGRVAEVVGALRQAHPGLEVCPTGTATRAFRFDTGTAPSSEQPSGTIGPAVAFPASAAEVQTIVRVASEHNVSIVPRGAGTGLSGGASASLDQLVVSTERLNRIVEVSPLDGVAVVEPGVINAALNAHLEPLGLFYAPDPASWEISTIGGNIATNAGGLRCAGYGVTRESVLRLDVVLADGSLVSVGHRSVKGVNGLDLTSLFVGSEGVLGIVVRATVRLRPVPVARRTISAFFPSTLDGLDGLDSITLSPVQPTVVEFFDEPSLTAIDAFSRTALRGRGASLVLVELDGYGIDEQTADLSAALTAAGAVVTAETDKDGHALWELRRHGRGQTEPQWFVGEDIAVPKSRLRDVYSRFAELEERFDVRVSAVSHAGDGNLHPAITKPIGDADPDDRPASLDEAATELVRIALAVGGTVTGEHGIGTVKREWAALELSPRHLAAQRALKDALDPAGLFNPGKAI